MTKTLRRLRSFILFRLIPVLLLLAVGGIICLGFVSYSPAFLKSNIIAEIARTGADSVSLQKASIRPWSGILLEGLYIRMKESQDRSVEFSAQRLHLTYKPMAVIIENKALRQTAARAAVMAQRISQASGSKADMAIRLVTQLIGERCIAEAVKSIHISGSRFAVWKKDQAVITADEINAALQMCSQDSLCIGGTMDAGVVMLSGSSYFIRPSATVRLSQQTLDVTKIKSYLYDGTLRGNLAMDIQRKKLLQAEFKLSNLSIEKWYETQRNPQGILKGKLACSFTCDSSALSLDSIVGQGSCKIRNVVAQDVPLQKNLVLLLAIPQLSKLEFNTVSSDFIIVDRRVNIQNFKANGDLLDIASDGWVAADGSFYQEVLGILSKKFSSQLPLLAQQSLLPRDNGRLAFDCQVSGTFDNPSLSLNQQIVKRAVKNVLESIGNDIQKFFK